MSGDPSSIGFGYQPYSSEPYGSADWAEEVTWKIIPEFYRDADALSPGLVEQPLRGFIDAIKPLFQEIREKLEIFPSLWDANRCPLPQLPALAYNIGLTLTSIQNLQLIDINPAQFTDGEIITGSISGSKGFLSPPTSTDFTIISIIGPGFKLGETLSGSSSGSVAVVESVAGTGSTQTVTVQTFIVGEAIEASQPPSGTGTKGIIGSVSSNSINIDTITGIGFRNGELITGASSKASGFINGITSDGTSERLLRSQVLNASQLWITKGTAKGYAIIAAFEGLLALVVPLYAENCDPDPNNELLTISGPASGSYLTYYDTLAADKLGLDVFFEDPFEAWPKAVDSVVKTPNLPEGRCRSYSLRVYFFTPDDTEIEDFDAISARVLTNLERFRPIYVRFDRVTFDGPHSSSQSWGSPSVIADSYSASGWYSSITGSLTSSSGSWTIP